MPRWYAACPRVGRPDTVAQQVATMVRQHDLGRVLPLLRFERRARGQFYLFLGIESESPGRLPPELEVLHQYPILRGLLRRGGDDDVLPFTLDEIQKMVSGEVSVQDYARRLARVILTPPVFAEPFPPDDPAADEAAMDERLLRSTQYDRLLAWLSAAGNGSLTVAQRACQALGLDPDGAQTGRILRRLRLLGHVEGSGDGRRWSIAPSVLTRVPGPAGSATYVLCGGRDGALIGALRRVAAVSQEPQPHGDAPARVVVSFEPGDDMAVLLQGAGAGAVPRVDDASGRLASVLPPIDRWPDLLERVGALQPERYDTLRYTAGGFIESPVAGSGLYELYTREGRGSHSIRPDYRLYYDAPAGRWLAGDWYGLRFLAHIADGRLGPAYYDILSARFALPEEWRPPELYERALVLCSGRLPERRRGWLYYDDVEPGVAAALAARLRFSMQEVDPHA